MIIIIFSSYVVPLLKYINHPALLQKWRLNIDSTAYENNIEDNVFKPSDKKKLIFVIATCTGQNKKIQCNGLLFPPLWNILQIF